ncbi:UNVERIFIED_CONTAM: Transcriptional elongation regulator MINIYO [Sesamum latifolium]|uniref:Transcriptional elongation regulator MINIYO n=1 Tax=Sesamum latifolium TaxID=2727402 RepID=A0AAW2V0Z6_9LAMI
MYHWGPKVGNFKVINDNDDVDEDVGEGEDCDGMELVAGVANPVERKEKKGLDFSRWKEIVKNDSNSVLYEKKKEMHSNALEVGHKTQERKSDNLNREAAGSDNAKLHGTSRVDNAKDHYMTKYDKVPSVIKEVKEKTEGMSEMASAKEFHSFEHVKNENIFNQASGHRVTLIDLRTLHWWRSLESQIDAENHARLAKMSADEIAEAQAEIMAKLNPELINALKKRGQAKVKRQKFSFSEITGGEAEDTQHEKNLSDLTTNSYNSISDKPVEKVPQDTPKDEGDKSFSNTSPQNRGLWDAWSKRVERVRNMRFSLDGNIIGSDFAHASDNGKAAKQAHVTIECCEASSASGYNADNVAERDFLRTEGDPGAAGYTIKEAVALTRSVAILDRAICSICRNQVGSASNCTDAEGSVDWEAIWAFALGPEPELALSLRMSLDDNHNSVVLACAKAIQSVLSCDMNDIIFDISEKAPKYARDVHTAPVFRSKPDVNSGFLRGGFWKYNTKPSNILCFPEESVGDTAEGEHTIQDDIVVAGQDFAAGLVRMGILPRICYLLETDPAAPLEECLISILIAISRHSPTCAAAVMDCGRLVQTVASRFASKEQMEINSCKIKSVMLLKVLARVEKKNCLTFIKNGIFRQVTWHLYRHPFSLDQWVKSGREACRFRRLCWSNNYDSGSVLKAVIKEDTMSPSGHLPWLPDFVPKIGLEIIKNGYLRFQGLPREDKVLANGILKSCAAEVQYLLTTLMKLITNEWQCMQPVEMFGRGGPAPGVGVGWGASGGGYWSSNVLLAQEDARLLIYLLEISEITFAEGPLEAGEMGQAMQRAKLLPCSLSNRGSRE